MVCCQPCCAVLCGALWCGVVCVVCVVCCVFCVHVVCVVWCGLAYGNHSVCRFKTPPCVRSRRTHGGVFNLHTEGFLFLLNPPLPHFFFTILQGIAGATDVSNFLRAFFDGFFEFRILRVDEIDSSQFSCVFKMELFIRPLLLFFQLGVLSH